MGKSWQENTRACGEQLRNILRGIYPRGAAKQIARDSGVPMRTVERILDGTSEPSFDTTIRLFAAYPQLLAVFEPVSSWGGVACAAVEEAALDAQRHEVRSRRERAAARMRGL